MEKRPDHDQCFTPSINVLKGRKEPAVYRELRVPAYRGNPLIEALPDILTDTEAATLLDAKNPTYNPSDRISEAHLRFHLLETALYQFFVTLPSHLDLQRRLSAMLRKGYLARNPTACGYWPNTEKRIAAIGSAGPTRRFHSAASGFTMLGISGIGKSYGLEAVLDLYPQVIEHRLYGDRPLTLDQIVWMKLDCPHDGSIRGLCLTFFQAVDDILGTNCYPKYAQRRTIDELLPFMARVASLHSLGVLVIDEIQHLSEAKSGGSSKMLNFFVQLVNTIGVPVVLIGTYKATSFLGSQLRQIRRGCGQGDMEWARMEKDSEGWRLFVDSLWDYQYTQRCSPLTDELRDVLYDETQGITDFAVKVYMLAQIRAIATGREEVTGAIIRSVARDSLQSAQKVLTALRTGDKRTLLDFEDVLSISIDEFLAKEKSRLRAKSGVSRRHPYPSGAATVQTLLDRLKLVGIEGEAALNCAQAAMSTSEVGTDLSLLCRKAIQLLEAEKSDEPTGGDIVASSTEGDSKHNTPRSNKGGKKLNETATQEIKRVESISEDFEGEKQD